jgi:hypothetical protein
MANTTNFNWETPDDTDLVKDGALAIRTLGSAIDTSLVDLKGGTTDQVLAKNSNTDMDFKWVADATGIPATIFDAKGDLIAASAADTAARLAVGANNTILTADSSTATGLKWAAPAAAGGMTLLSTTSLSGSSVTVSSISQAYKNLVIYVKDMTFSSGEAELRLRLNGDTASNYITVSTYADERLSPLFATNGLVGTLIRISGLQHRFNSANFFAELQIPDYTNSTTAKIVKIANKFNDQDDSSQGVSMGTAAWSKAPEAINEITVLLSASTFSAGSIEIYGVN